jgi:hypothetical protein
VVSKDGLKIKFWNLILRFLGVVAEFVLSFYTVMGAILISYTMMVFTKDNRSAHDFLSFTKTCDLKKSIIFKTKEEAEEYEQKIKQEEEAAILRQQMASRFRTETDVIEPETKPEEKKE